MIEKILSDMFTTVKVLTFLIIVCSIVILTIKVCETTKRDFKSFKDLFRLLDNKRLTTINSYRKPKKESKQLKDFKIHYVDVQQNLHDYHNSHPLPHSHPKLQSQSPPIMHTLRPLSLPVHLPIPIPPETPSLTDSQADPSDLEQSVAPSPLSLPQPPPPTLMSQQEHHLHYHHIHHHHNIPPPMLAQPSSQIFRSDPQSIIIHQRFNTLFDPQFDPIINTQFDPMGMDMSASMPDHLVFPVFEQIPMHLDEPMPTKLQRKPNTNSEIDDTVLNLAIDSNYRNNDRNVRKNNNNRKPNNKEDDSHEWRTSSGLRLVNTDKFRAITKQRFSNGFYNDDNIYNRKAVKSIQDFKVDDTIRRPESSNKMEKTESQVREGSDSRDDRIVYTKESDNEHNFNLPDEHAVNVEDEWTFKDLDLWVVR